MGDEGALDQSGSGKVGKEGRDSRNSVENKGLSTKIICLYKERDEGTRPPGRDLFHPGFQPYLP